MDRCHWYLHVSPKVGCRTSRRAIRRNALLWSLKPRHDHFILLSSHRSEAQINMAPTHARKILYELLECLPFEFLIPPAVIVMRQATGNSLHVVRVKLAYETHTLQVHLLAHVNRMWARETELVLKDLVYISRNFTRALASLY